MDDEEIELLTAMLSSEDELIQLIEAWQQDWSDKRQRGRYPDTGAVNLSLLGDDVCRKHFRFTWSEMLQLSAALELPDCIVCDNRVKCDRDTALAMLLRRLCYPARLVDFERMWGWESSRFSRITNTTAHWILSRWRHVLVFDSSRLTPRCLARFARKVHRKGAPLRTCWAFIDGTLREIARPVRNQRIVFNGWKRIHALKYQILSTPDGMIVHVFGPVEGRRHDSTVYRTSGLEELLATHSRAPDGQPLFIYGDPAYGLGAHLVTPFRNAQAREERLFNSKMSKVRESVEWAFGEITQHFAYLDYAKNQKVLLQPVGVLYLVGILFTNALNIFHPNKTSVYFDCKPPTLAEYFHGVPAATGDDNDITQTAGETVPYGEFTVHADDLDMTLPDSDQETLADDGTSSDESDSD